MTYMKGPADPDHLRQQVGRYGDRFYVDNLPLDAGIPLAPEFSDLPQPSVSVIKNAWPKFLTAWAGQEAAKYAVEHQNAWRSLEYDAAVDLIANASDRVKNQAARRGSMIHELIEDLSVGRRPNYEAMPDNVTPFIGIAERLVHDLRLEPIATEAVVFNHAIGYGGTFDMIADSVLGRGLWDWKTRKAPTPYPEEACQGAAYLGGEYMIVEDINGHAVREVIPDVDFLAIVVMAPDAYKVHEINEEQAWETWETLAAFWKAKAKGKFFDGVMPVRPGPRIDAENIKYRITTLGPKARDYLAKTWPGDLPTPKQNPEAGDWIRIENHVANVEARAAKGFNFAPPEDECGIADALEVGQMLEWRQTHLDNNQRAAVVYFINGSAPTVSLGTASKTNRRLQIHWMLNYAALCCDGSITAMGEVLPNEIGIISHDGAIVVKDELREQLVRDGKLSAPTTETESEND